ncbi:MAG: hypothetical protein KGS72_12965 [Cyanobacteria bacterium REEB67]|nr:hypothetical protein [Cyanobacteria bacterium REEB67]
MEIANNQSDRAERPSERASESRSLVDMANPSEAKTFSAANNNQSTGGEFSEAGFVNFSDPYKQTSNGADRQNGAMPTARDGEQKRFGGNENGREENDQRGDFGQGHHGGGSDHLRANHGHRGGGHDRAGNPGHENIQPIAATANGEGGVSAPGGDPTSGSNQQGSDSSAGMPQLPGSDSGVGVGVSANPSEGQDPIAKLLNVDLSRLNNQQLAELGQQLISAIRQDLQTLAGYDMTSGSGTGSGSGSDAGSTTTTPPTGTGSDSGSGAGSTTTTPPTGSDSGSGAGSTTGSTGSGGSGPKAGDGASTTAGGKYTDTIIQDLQSGDPNLSTVLSDAHAVMSSSGFAAYESSVYANVQADSSAGVLPSDGPLLVFSMNGLSSDDKTAVGQVIQTDLAISGNAPISTFQPDTAVQDLKATDPVLAQAIVNDYEFAALGQESVAGAAAFEAAVIAAVDTDGETHAFPTDSTLLTATSIASDPNDAMYNNAASQNALGSMGDQIVSTYAT